MEPLTDELLDRFEKIRNDPIEFLKAVNTKDEVDEKNPIKKFPIHKDYLKLYVRLWQKEKKIAVPKSRRMTMSWTNISLWVWDTMFHVGRNHGFVSKKEEDAADLVERAKFIVENLDEAIIPKELRPRHEHTFNKLRFPEIDSQIRGFPQGADQLRQFTFSGLLFDEMAFWEYAEDAYSAALPTVDGGGRIVMLSSPSPGFFKRLVFDQLDRSSEDGVIQG